MIITKTPFRMSFFGGGTDMEEYFRQHSGAVISTTIDKYCYVTVRHLPGFFSYKNQIVYSKMEKVRSVDEIEHPAVREAMKLLNMQDLVISYDADLPARSGLGTSSSFAVGLLKAFHCLKGRYVDKYLLAKEAIYLERTLCNEAGGWQDQIAASFGGLNRIDFRNNDFQISPVIISPMKKEMLNKNLMLFFTGFSRLSSEIQKDTKKSMNDSKVQLREIQMLVDEAQEILVDRDSNLDEFGRLLDYTWKLKRQIGNRVSTENIDLLYETAINAGATGGKLLGAGGGGFLVFYVPEERQKAVREKLKHLMYVPFLFDERGTDVIYYSAETYRPELAGE